MGKAQISTGPHAGHTHYECDACGMYFETDKELMEHGEQVHAQKVPAM